MTAERRYRIGDRVVGHAWAAPRYRLRLGTVTNLYQFTPPPGFKAYQVQWMIDGQTEYAWHDERELSPLRKDDDDSGN